MTDRPDPADLRRLSALARLLDVALDKLEERGASPDDRERDRAGVRAALAWAEGAADGAALDRAHAACQRLVDPTLDGPRLHATWACWALTHAAFYMKRYPAQNRLDADNYFRRMLAADVTHAVVAALGEDAAGLAERAMEGA